MDSIRPIPQFPGSPVLVETYFSPQWTSPLLSPSSIRDVDVADAVDDRPLRTNPIPSSVSPLPPQLSAPAVSPSPFHSSSASASSATPPASPPRWTVVSSQSSPVMSSSSSSSSSSASSSTSSSSWFEKAKVAANAAAEATKKAAVYVADQSKQTYENLKAPPSTVQCSGCPLQVEVPPSIFDWTCVNQHSNDRNASVCAVCNAPKPKLNPPHVVCSSCHSSTVVPSSNAGKHLSEAATSTKKFAVSTTAAAKEQIKYLSSAPETFHCAHCNSLLAVPTGPWACQTCTAENAEDAMKCRQCGQKKSEQKAICGVCRQSTVIPTTNFFDGLKATTRDLAKSSSKVYLDVSGKSYVTCSRCGSHVQLTAPAAPGEKGGEVKPAHPAVVGGGAEGQPHAEGGAVPTAAQQAELKELVCPSCKNKIEG